jgi:glyoxylase-like metal-dependent hydrolase (beta-lactamase superfamily II)
MSARHDGLIGDMRPGLFTPPTHSCEPAESTILSPDRFQEELDCEVIVFKKTVAFVMFAIFATYASPAAFSQDAKTVLSNASKAMGADNLKSVQYSGTGTEFSLGQAVNPNSAWPGFADKSYARTINYETPASRVDRVLADIPPVRRGGGLPPGPTQSVVINANTPWAQQVDLWMTPYGFLRAAASNNATAKSQSMGGKKYTVVTFTPGNNGKVNGYFDEQNMLARVETWVDNPMLGDTPVEVSYSNYKDFGGLKFPTTILQKQGGYPTLDLSVTEVKPNAPANIQPPPPQPAAPAATSQKLADGVYLMLPAYAALAVDFKDYIVIVEGPQSEARASAIITEAKRVIPNKPIKYVVNTHQHFDHSSGLRTFIAEGATIITYQGNKAYYERIFAQPHTLNPDRQAEAKKKISIEGMGDKRVLTDGNHVIELHRLQGSNHNDGLIIAYLPKEKILVEADAFNPPAQLNAPPPTVINPNTVNLLDNIERLKLDVETIIPIHYPVDSRKVAMSELLRAVGKGT